MYFGKNLQVLRKMTGMTQEQLAEKLNVSRQTILKWELGVSNCETVERGFAPKGHPPILPVETKRE